MQIVDRASIGRENLVALIDSLPPESEKERRLLCHLILRPYSITEEVEESCTLQDIGAVANSANESIRDNQIRISRTPFSDDFLWFVRALE